MQTIRILLCGAVTVVMLGLGQTSEAGWPTTYNPYRSFNLSGINYGAQQWDAQHKNSNTSKNATYRVRGRRGR